MKTNKSMKRQMLSVIIVLCMIISIAPYNILEASAKTVKATKIQLNYSTYKIVIGKSTTLKATVIPVNAVNKVLLWISSNKKIVTVSNKGVIKGIKEGKAIITVIVKGTSVKAVCRIEVQNQLPKLINNGIPSDSVEKRIKSALINKTSYIFKISGKYTFMLGAGGIKIYKDENGTTTYKQSAEWAQDSIEGSSLGGFIRIDEGNVSMEDSTNYTCSLKINQNDEGVSININHVKCDTNDSYLNGTIKGNVLTASEQVGIAFYSPFTKTGFGTSASGQYSIGLVDVPKEQWPPMPAVLSYSRNCDKSVTLTWEDKNPSTFVGYYEIYRMVGVTNEYSKVATVSNCTTWTDSSDEVKNEFTNMLDYYIIVYNKTGINSPRSNDVIFSVCNF